MTEIIQVSVMDDFQLCSSLIFKLTNDSAIYDVLEEISLIYDVFFKYFLLYLGPALVLANAFAIFILTRKELRTPYNIFFLVMALDQSITILASDLLLWRKNLNLDAKSIFGCGFIYTLPYQIFEIAIMNLCPMCGSHASWLAVIITFVRLRHISSSTGEPSLRYIISLCCSSFALIFLAGIPLFLSFDIYWIDAYQPCDGGEEMTGRTIPYIFESARLYENDCLLLRITYISSGILYNALPCILLIFLSAALMYQLYKIRKSHAHLVIGCAASNAESVRSSWMVAMIVLTTLITDVPQAIINILVGFMSDRFRSTVANKLGALIATLVIFSSAANLTIYLCMSRRIREVTMSYLCFVCRKVKSAKSSRFTVSSPTPQKF